MTVQEFIQAVLLRATRKTTTLLSSSAKYAQILALGNYWQRSWANEDNWSSLYNPALSIGTVTATDSFDLDPAIRVLSDRQGDVVRIMWTDGVGYTDYDIIPHDKLKDTYWGQSKENPNGNYCTRMGDQLVFNHTFTTKDPQYGGDIQVPCYVFTDELINPTDEIQVDDPNWLVTISAADYCRNDVTRISQVPLLMQEAKDKMIAMKEAEANQIDTVDAPWTPFSGLGVNSAWS